MRKYVLFLLAIITAVALMACSTGEDAGEEKPADDDAGETEGTDGDDEGGEKIFYINNGDEPKSLDPSIGFDSVSWTPLNNLMEGLTRLNEESVADVGVAEEWDISEDGKTYTFHLREDAKWSNGDPVVAGDFEYAWKYMLDPDTASEAAFLGYFIEGAEEYNTGEGDVEDVAITSVDDQTLEVVLKHPTGFFLDLISNPAFFPINQEVAEENEKWHAEADTFVGNGPFKLEEWNHDSDMFMAKNEHYWDADAVNLDGVDWAMVEDTNTSYQMYESGDLDIGSIPSELSDQLIDGDDVRIEEEGGLEFYRFNVTEEPFTNKKVRQAFAFAVDRAEIAEFVVKNRVEPAYGYISPGFTAPDGSDFRDENEDLVTFDPEKAKELLEEGMEEEGWDELPEVTLSYNTSDTNKAVAEALQDMYIEHLDVEVTLENLEWQVFSDAQVANELQFSRSSFLNDYDDPINFLESFITDSYMNRTGFSSEEYDALIEDGKYEADDEARWEAMYEAERMLADEMMAMPIRYYNDVTLEKEGVEGVLRHPVGYLDLKFADKK